MTWIKGETNGRAPCFICFYDNPSYI